MGPVEALELALRKEIEAKELYTQLSIKFPEIKDIFIFLANEEEKHRKAIEERISKLTRF